MHEAQKRTFSATDGTTLWYEYWGARTQERGRIYVVHGLGSAATEYALLGQVLAEQGLTVICTNQRGDGYDPIRARCGRFFEVDQLHADLLALLIATNAAASEVPVFLLGESMGALQVWDFLQANAGELTNGDHSQLHLNFAPSAISSTALRFPPLKGSILLCPVVQLAQNTPWIVRQIAYLAAALFPDLAFPPSFFVHGKKTMPQLTTDCVYQQQIQSAPHRINAFSLGFTAKMGRLIDKVYTQTNSVSTPILVLGGANDVYIRPHQLKTWFDRLTTPDKTLHIFPQSYHLLLHDIEQRDVVSIIGRWIEKHL